MGITKQILGALNKFQRPDSSRRARGARPARGRPRSRNFFRVFYSFARYRTLSTSTRSACTDHNLAFAVPDFSARIATCSITHGVTMCLRSRHVRRAARSSRPCPRRRDRRRPRIQQRAGGEGHGWRWHSRVEEDVEVRVGKRHP